MLTSIHLRNFRAFRELAVGPFNRVNLIAGFNNTGKTGLLEAIFLVLADKRNRPLPDAGALPTLFRVSPQDPNESFWRWILPDKSREIAAEIQINDHEHGVETAKFAANDIPLKDPSGNFPLTENLGSLACYRSKRISTWLPKVAVFSTHPSDPRQDAIDYNRVIAKRGRKKVENLLAQIEPRLQAIESLQTGNAPVLYADVGLPEMIPVTNLGQGFCRLLDIYAEILAGDAKVLLIDEIENGLHHSVLPVVWKGLIAAANQLDVQIFATTHSAECIFAADQAAREEEPHELNLIRLDRAKDTIKATVMDKNTLSKAKELDWELR